MTIEEKILEWVAMASSVNQVTGVKLAEILTEMNDVIATVNANNQALVATNQQMQATLNSLSNDLPALQASLNAHVNNANVHLSANDKSNLNFIGVSYNLAQVQLVNGVTQSTEYRQVYYLARNGNKLQMSSDDYQAYVSGVDGSYVLNIYKITGTPILVTLNYGIKVVSFENDNYRYRYALQANTLQEALDLTRNLRIIWVFYNGFY